VRRRRGAGATRPIAGVIGGAVLVVATPCAIWRTESLYRALRGRLSAQLGVVLFAAALVAAVFPFTQPAVVAVVHAVDAGPR
jgi:hypothetical protein